MTTSRSNAAYKAHETRKANAIAKKRSDAAKKAWDTRRKLTFIPNRSAKTLLKQQG